MDLGPAQHLQIESEKLAHMTLGDARAASIEFGQILKGLKANLAILRPRQILANAISHTHQTLEIFVKYSTLSRIRLAAHAAV